MKGLRTFAVFVVLIAFVGLGAYLATHHQPLAPPTPAPAPVVKKPVESPPIKVKIYQIEMKDSQPTLHQTEEEIPAKGNPMAAALRKLFAQADTENLSNPMPKGTRLLGLKVKRGLATVNLSHEFRDNFTGGSEAEGLTIGAILRTLAQFPKVKRVLFLVEGKPLDSLGHLDISGPQDVNWTGPQFGGEN